MERPDPGYWRTRSDAPASGTILSPLSAIPDGEGKEFVFGGGKAPFRMFVVRLGERAWGYVNVCPHFSLPLNYRPDEFMSSDGTLLMCTMHFALFRIEDGLCVEGSCVGHYLDPVPLTIDAAGILVIG